MLLCIHCSHYVHIMFLPSGAAVWNSCTLCAHNVYIDTLMHTLYLQCGCIHNVYINVSDVEFENPVVL